MNMDTIFEVIVPSGTETVFKQALLQPHLPFSFFERYFDLFDANNRIYNDLTIAHISKIE